MFGVLELLINVLDMFGIIALVFVFILFQKLNTITKRLEKLEQEKISLERRGEKVVSQEGIPTKRVNIKGENMKASLKEIPFYQKLMKKDSRINFLLEKAPKVNKSIIVIH